MVMVGDWIELPLYSTVNQGAQGSQWISGFLLKPQLDIPSLEVDFSPSVHFKRSMGSATHTLEQCP